MPRPTPCCRSVLSAWSVVLAVGALVSVVVLAPERAVAQGSGTSTLGKGTGTGPIMTREELRTCLRGQEELNRRSQQLDPEAKALEQEKAAIEAERQSLASARAELDGAIRRRNEQVASINARRTEVAARIADWNRRRDAFVNENRSGRSADRQREQLEQEQAQLDRERDEVNALAVDEGPVRDATTAYNARAAALDQRIGAWNTRQARAAEESTRLSDERELWVVECGNRRYLTDDEAAIRRGQ